MGIPVDPPPGAAQEPPAAIATPTEPEPPASSAEAAASRDAGRDECAVIAVPGEPITTVGLTDPIDPSNAPHPANASERLLFRQVYETLVRVDCLGRVSPGLAASWRLDTDGRTWIVTLREGARFSDGTPVTAAGVRASWTRGSVDGALRPHVSRLAQSVDVADDRTLVIRLRSHREEAPAALAHPDLAVARVVADSPWPLGTRDGAPVTDGSVITLVRDHLPGIRFLAAPGDPRDLLDKGVDLLLTRDPAALDYAATLPHFQSVPLSWQRTHVLLAPGRPPSAPPLPEAARQALAADAVRGEARGAQGPFWWEMAAGCAVAPSPPPTRASLTPRIVYDANDGAARDLAERFVGLGTYQRAAGLTGDALTRERQAGTAAGYVAAVESRPLDPCRDLQLLVDGARWLDPATIVALVDTRLRAIVRRGRSGLAAEFDGGLIIGGENDPAPR
jgi:hypothetical protein